MSIVNSINIIQGENLLYLPRRERELIFMAHIRKTESFISTQNTK